VVGVELEELEEVHHAQLEQQVQAQLVLEEAVALRDERVRPNLVVRRLLAKGHLLGFGVSHAASPG
jgi:hypothetical protein